jgi:hypothetical protein
MKISEAKKRVTKQRIIASMIMIISVLFIVCAGLKSIYFTMQDQTNALSSFTQVVQDLVYLVYERTQFAFLFWKWAPIINLNQLNTPGNFVFSFIFTCAAIGRLMLDSASNLSSRIAKTIRKVEELGWEQELMGQRGSIQTTRPDVLQINIELDQKDQWYKRPTGLVLIGVAIAILGQWANLKFGLVK